MNRLQKKCLIATAGFHLLLVLVIVFGAAFFTSEEKPEDTQPLTVIPSTTIDKMFNSGVKNPQTPPPAPTPAPPEPKAVVTPPTLIERVEKIFTPEPPKLLPDDLTPKEPTSKPKEHKIQVDKTLVTHNVPKVAEVSDADAREAAKAAKLRAKAIAKIAQTIKENASPETTIEMPGTGSVSYANYASVVKSIYERAWRTPDDASNDDANTRVSVTIGSDGNVISSRILDGSGDAKVDASVQRTLDNVSFVAPFPDGAKEKEKTFIINFNLKAKRMNG